MKVIRSSHWENIYLQVLSFLFYRSALENNIPTKWPLELLHSGGSRGHEGYAPPAQHFFIFMQFSGKIGQIICWRPSKVSAPLGEILDPPLLEVKFVCSVNEISSHPQHADLLIPLLFCQVFNKASGGRICAKVEFLFCCFLFPLFPKPQKMCT